MQAKNEGLRGLGRPVWGVLSITKGTLGGVARDFEVRTEHAAMRVHLSPGDVLRATCECGGQADTRHKGEARERAVCHHIRAVDAASWRRRSAGSRDAQDAERCESNARALEEEMDVMVERIEA